VGELDIFALIFIISPRWGRLGASRPSERCDHFDVADLLSVHRCFPSLASDQISPPDSRPLQALVDLARDVLNRGAQAGPSGRRVPVAHRPLQRRGASFLREELPPDAAGQSRYLRDLNQSGQHDAVVQIFESGRLVNAEGALGEYVTALAHTNRLNNTALLQTLQKGYEAAVRPSSAAVASQTAGFGGSGSFASRPLEAALGGSLLAGAGPGAAAAASLGTARNPLYTMQAEPTFWAQLWRSVRVLSLAFLFMAGLGAMVEERGGLSRSILNNPDMRPQVDTKTKFADVKGVDEAKAELEEIVAYLRDPGKFTVLGGKLPKGVLLVGPPGTGKTMLARAIAGEAGVPFFYTSGSEFEEMFVGVGARRVRDLFAAAKKAAPCIIFIDEIDAIGGSRNPKDQQYMKMTLNQLLVELDGFRPSEGVIVVAATNFPESLDRALIRPGRFDRHVVVPNPDVEGRRQILEVHFKGVKRSNDTDLRTIAKGTPGFSGADLANLVNVAALKAARDGKEEVDMAALEYAKDRILMGAERKSAVISEKNRRLTAYHEGGHALVALYTDGAHPVHKATVVPRGMALGMVMQLPETDDETSVTRRQLLAKLDVAMGGRVAEELIFGEKDITTGASSDLEQATRLARSMVTKYGMSEAVGQVAIGYEDSSLSSESRALVEAEVKSLLQGAYERARKVLKQHEHELHALAAELVEKETLSGIQIKELLARVAAGGGTGGRAAAAAG
jgi:ATP-dependent metalloprotease